MVEAGVMFLDPSFKLEVKSRLNCRGMISRELISKVWTIFPSVCYRTD